MRTSLAWLAHLYTGMGLVAAAMIAVLVVRGGDEAFRLCFVLMLVATLIDATDGWFARKVDVAHATPGFDGRRLDDLIDFHTYTTLPLLLLWRADILPPPLQWMLLLPLLASAYGFSQAKAKTDDDFFLGFPSYWNIVAFYLILLPLPVWVRIAILAGLALLTFVPSMYLYPTKGTQYRLLTNLLAGAWTLSLLALMFQWRSAPPVLVWASLGFPIYYLTLSWIITIKAWRTRRRGSAAPGR